MIATEKNPSEVFAQKMLEVMNHAALALMTSIGHRTRLFDVMALLPCPATSQEIARAAELNERYVREWLGAMTIGGVVEHDEHSNTYALPAEHAAWLTRASSPNNLASANQWFSVLGAVEDQVVAAFKHGRGVPYSAYHRFHDVMAEESSQTVVAGLLEHILPLAPGLIDQLERGIRVLDVGCGSGRAMNYLARRFPLSRFAGYDFSEEGIHNANEEARRKELTNVRFGVVDVAEFHEPESYDLITAFDAIHDQAHPDKVLQRIARALKPGGLFLMQDIRGSSHVHCNHDVPLAVLGYTISCMHCMSVSLANNGIGLGAMWGKEKALQMLADAGFGNVHVETLPHDLLNYYYLCRR
jgi:2-polyprenyl-3-methyl-5-hydroxy-6-metoxy-1,4-benzoquinol methylase